MNFKVDDVVCSKCNPQIRLHIIERIEETCPGGTQVNYTCRAHSSSEPSFAVDTVKMNSIELMELPKPNPKQGFAVGDVTTIPNHETVKGYRIWRVEGIHLGGVEQESTYHLRSVDWDDNAEIHVPCIILETHPNIELVQSL